MGVNSGTQSRREQFDELMRAGNQALEAGDRRAAHDRWREAATIDPYSEQVWLSLLRVLDDEEDRRVCLENIIAINPMNVQARRLMHRQGPEASTATAPVPAQATESVTQPRRPDTARPKKKTATQARAAVNSKSTQKQTQKQKKATRAKPKPKQSSIGRLLLLVIGALVIAVLLGLVVSVVVFARH